MTEGWKTPLPDDLETMRQFWDATLDRFAEFVEVNHDTDRRAATRAYPPTLVPRWDRRSYSLAVRVGRGGGVWVSTGEKGSPRGTLSDSQAKCHDGRWKSSG